VVTQIDGGHAENALPQRVQATVNCRILPGVPIADVRAEIKAVLADETISVEATGEPGFQFEAPPLSAAIIDPVKKVAATLWPGVPLVPSMTAAYTDGKYLNAGGVPTYGMSGMFFDPEGSGAHGLNERIRVKSLMDGRRFLHEVVKIYANSKEF